MHINSVMMWTWAQEKKELAVGVHAFNPGSRRQRQRQRQPGEDPGEALQSLLLVTFL